MVNPSTNHFDNGFQSVHNNCMNLWMDNNFYETIWYSQVKKEIFSDCNLHQRRDQSEGAGEGGRHTDHRHRIMHHGTLMIQVILEDIVVGPRLFAFSHYTIMFYVACYVYIRKCICRSKFRKDVEVSTQILQDLDARTLNLIKYLYFFYGFWKQCLKL